MRPDLVFYRRGEPVLVADIKYKLTDDGLGRNADYYQLLAYCSAFGLNWGLLIYGAESAEERASSRTAWSGQQLDLVPVYLGGAQKEILTGLGRLAENLATPLRVRMRPVQPRLQR
jgi:5-methylcytosine-specific restriction enzyme subunit McrC